MRNFLVLTFVISFSTGLIAGPMQLQDVEPVKDCTGNGIMCETCTTSVMCIKMGTEYKKVNRMTCNPGSSCLAGTCTKEVNPPCDYVNVPFPCQYQGAYPHPGDWSKYIYCIPNSDGSLFTAYTMDCEPGTGYSANTTYCSRNLANILPTHFPVDRCLTPSTSPIVHPDNPSIYYICGQISADSDKLYPIQFTCPSGGAFVNGECQIVLSNDTTTIL